MLVVVCEDAVSYTEDVCLYFFLCPTVVLMHNFGMSILQGLQQCTGKFLVVRVEGL